MRPPLIPVLRDDSDREYSLETHVICLVCLELVKDFLHLANDLPNGVLSKELSVKKLLTKDSLFSIFYQTLDNKDFAKVL
jgi:hypothetical protein